MATSTTIPSSRSGRSAMGRATQALADTSVYEVQQLRVDETEDELQLRGRVRSFYHKQIAQEALLRIADGRQVVNHVDVTSA